VAPAGTLRRSATGLAAPCRGVVARDWTALLLPLSRDIEIVLVFMCHHDHMSMPDDADAISNIVLMSDPRVTVIPVSDNGEELTDVRDYGLRVSSFRADDAGDFAHVRA
jgi:hypothetical protein